MDTTSSVLLPNNGSVLPSNSSTNTSSQEVDIPDMSFPVHMVFFVTLSFILVFVAGIVGNLMVILVVVKNLRMRSSTNLFLVNLSVADFAAILFCVPIAMSEFYGKDVWHLGEVMCKFVYFLQYTVVNTSVLIILAISFERYYAICFPLKAKYMCTTGRTIKTMIVIWVVGIILNTPFIQMAFLQNTKTTTTAEAVQVCQTDISSTWSRIYIICNVFVFFLLPFFILIFLYGRIIHCLLSRDNELQQKETMQTMEQSMRTRRQVVFMLISMIVLFFICLLPLRVLSIWVMYVADKDLALLGFQGYYSILYFSRIMFFINSAGNPILYNLFSSKFRRAFKDLLCSRHANTCDGSVRSCHNETAFLTRPWRNQECMIAE